MSHVPFVRQWLTLCFVAFLSGTLWLGEAQSQELETRYQQVVGLVGDEVLRSDTTIYGCAELWMVVQPEVQQELAVSDDQFAQLLLAIQELNEFRQTVPNSPSIEARSEFGIGLLSEVLSYEQFVRLNQIVLQEEYGTRHIAIPFSRPRFARLLRLSKEQQTLLRDIEVSEEELPFPGLFPQPPESATKSPELFEQWRQDFIAESRHYYIQSRSIELMRVWEILTAEQRTHMHRLFGQPFYASFMRDRKPFLVAEREALGGRALGELETRRQRDSNENRGPQRIM